MTNTILPEQQLCQDQYWTPISEVIYLINHHKHYYSSNQSILIAITNTKPTNWLVNNLYGPKVVKAITSQLPKWQLSIVVEYLLKPDFFKLQY